jgi:hypothetical protein
MPRILRERPRRTSAAALALIAVLTTGWLAGAGVAGSAPRPVTHTRTIVSTTTETATQTVTVCDANGDGVRTSIRAAK